MWTFVFFVIQADKPREICRTNLYTSDSGRDGENRSSQRGWHCPGRGVRPLPIFFSQKIRRRGKIIFENAKQGKKGGLCVLFEIYFFRFICWPFFIFLQQNLVNFQEVRGNLDLLFFAISIFFRFPAAFFALQFFFTEIIAFIDPSW